ncbi:MAG: hypothetical protein ABIH20_02855 [Candidatus Diapherotrites archaeon]
MTAKTARHPLRAGRAISVMEQRRVIEGVRAWLEANTPHKYSLEQTRKKMRAVVEQEYARELSRIPSDKKKAYSDKLLQKLIQKMREDPDHIGNPLLHAREMHR